jgi:hypothetical protein
MSRVGENIQSVHDLVMSDRGITTRIITDKQTCANNFKRRFKHVQPELWAEKNWILHHNNAPSHLVLTVHEFFAKNDMITTDHPSYLDDLATWDLFLFHKVKTNILGM